MFTSQAVQSSSNCMVLWYCNSCFCTAVYLAPMHDTHDVISAANMCNFDIYWANRAYERKWQWVSWTVPEGMLGLHSCVIQIPDRLEQAFRQNPWKFAKSVCEQTRNVRSFKFLSSSGSPQSPWECVLRMVQYTGMPEWVVNYTPVTTQDTLTSHLLLLSW